MSYRRLTTLMPLLLCLSLSAASLSAAEPERNGGAADEAEPSVPAGLASPRATLRTLSAMNDVEWGQSQRMDDAITSERAMSVQADPEVQQLLVVDEAPAGVVFEIVEDEEDALTWALPRARAYAKRLRERFPGLPIVVVTHGPEQFALLSSEAEGELSGIHDEARGLHDDGIDLHVCGAHAGWYGHVPEDFPSYVDVSPSGPAQINDYRDLGYEVILLQSDQP